MKHARVAYGGAIHSAVEENGMLRLVDGRLVDEQSVVWLPPVRCRGTILALGLNYADHAKELAFKAPEEPLVFLKGEQRAQRPPAGHDAPAGRRAVHALRMRAGGRDRQDGEARSKRDDAYDFIAGYTVANDYAIRDYLENWYRPNLRVKNRDGGTPLGPWLVDAADVAGPAWRWRCKTTVNGKVTQEGNTKDMIFDVPFLIEYFSSFMTLKPGRPDPHRHARRRGRLPAGRRGRHRDRGHRRPREHHRRTHPDGPHARSIT